MSKLVLVIAVSPVSSNEVANSVWLGNNCFVDSTCRAASILLKHVNSAFHCLAHFRAQLFKLLLELNESVYAGTDAAATVVRRHSTFVAQIGQRECAAAFVDTVQG